MSTIKKINLNGTEYELGGSGGLTDDVKVSLLALCEKVAYIDENGQDYYDALEAALSPPADLSYITAVYTQSGTVCDTDTLNSLKADLVVTAHYDDSTSATVTAYTLSGTLTEGTSTITVSYGGKTDTFNVTVTHYVNYADSLANWVRTNTSSVSYGNNMITMKGSQANADAFLLWTFDRAKTLWDDVQHKTLKIRITLDSPDWSGAFSDDVPRNSVFLSLAIFKNATITSGNDRQKMHSLERVALSAQSHTFEYTFVAELENFEVGTGTPTSQSTFGITVYDCSAHEVHITSAEVVEVLS